MKLKDLPPNQSIQGIKVKLPDSMKVDVFLAGLNTLEVFIYSQWAKGIWVKKNMSEERVFPICMENPAAALEWEVLDG